MLKVLKQSLTEIEDQMQSPNSNMNYAASLGMWAIYTRGLYKTVGSFEQYCNDVWHIPVTTGYRLIGLVDDSVGQYALLDRFFSPEMIIYNRNHG